MWIPENAYVGTTITRVQAKDIDSGDLGTKGIRYTNLSGSVADMWVEFFSTFCIYIITTLYINGTIYPGPTFVSHFITTLSKCVILYL